MSENDELRRWGTLVVDCLKSFQEQQDLSIRFVDFEVMPHFDGSAEDMWVWFICARSAETSPFREDCLEQATDELRKRLLQREFPESAAPSLGTDVTSSEEIEAGGGRFAYFR